jgi:hypothetical protein
MRLHTTFVKYLPYVGICFHHMMEGESCVVWDDEADRKAKWDFGSLLSGKWVLEGCKFGARSCYIDNHVRPCRFVKSLTTRQEA